MAPDCENGYHAALVAQAPLVGDDCVEIDFVCPHCRAVIYTQSWGKEAWLRTHGGPPSGTGEGRTRPALVAQDLEKPQGE